jgi:hypothetical protein
MMKGYMLHTDLQASLSQLDIRHLKVLDHTNHIDLRRNMHKEYNFQIDLLPINKVSSPLLLLDPYLQASMPLQSIGLEMVLLHLANYMDSPLEHNNRYFLLALYKGLRNIQ